MWQQDSVDAVGKPRLDGWLVLVDVEPGTFDPAFPQSLDQRLLIHDRAARGVDQEMVGSHQPELALPDQMARLIVQIRVDGDEVGFAQEFVERNIDRPKLGLDLGSGAARICIEDGHAEAEPPARHRLADATESDDPQRPPVDIAA